MKNLIYVGIIAVCLLVAGIIIFSRGSGGSGLDDLSDDEQVQVLCMECKASYEMGKKEYYKQLQEKAQTAANPLAARYLDCEKCGKDAIVKAVKCEKCGHIFRENSVPNDIADRCPKCKFSKIEAVRAERKKNMAP